MKHCVLLSEAVIRFVGDQWGDLEPVPAGDDGLMSLGKTIRNCQWENASQHQHSSISALILHFLQQNIYSRYGDSHFYDTFTPQSKWSETTTDANLILGGFHDLSGMVFLFLMVLSALGTGGNNIFSDVLAGGGVDDLENCSRYEFKGLALKLDRCTTQNKLINHFFNIKPITFVL